MKSLTTKQVASDLTKELRTLAAEGGIYCPFYGCEFKQFGENLVSVKYAGGEGFVITIGG